MPREPDEGAVTMQAFAGSKLAGTWTISVTFCRPDPSSAKAKNSLPAIRPSLAVAWPSSVTLGP
jgi:hypothetical protein